MNHYYPSCRKELADLDVAAAAAATLTALALAAVGVALMLPDYDYHYVPLPRHLCCCCHLDLGDLTPPRLQIRSSATAKEPPYFRASWQRATESPWFPEPAEGR